MLDGRWKATYAELGGSVLTGDIVSAIELQLEAGPYTVGNDHGTCSINMDRSPHEMDITGTEGPNAGRTIPALALLLATVLAPIDWNADLDFLQRELPKTHPNAFHATSRQTWESAIASLRERAPSMSPAAVTV